MAQLTPARLALLARASRRLTTLGLAVALTAGCTATGQVIAPTAQPGRLLDPTAPAVTVAPTQAGAATAAPGTPAPTAVAAPVQGTLQIIGLVESIDGEIWVIDGLRVRVPAGAQLGPNLGVGSLVRAIVQVQDDDDDDEQSVVAVSVTPVRELPLVGQIGAIDATTIVIDGRTLLIPAGVVIPAGLGAGTIVRVIVDDDGGKLVLRLIQPLVEARVLGGSIELIDGEFIVIGGQRLRLAPELVLWRVRLVTGEPVRIIVVPVDGVLTIVTITAVTIVIPPPVVVVPVPPTAVPTAVPPPPPPAPRPAPPSNSGNSDDDDDDDDD